MTCKIKGILLRISPTVHEERALTVLAESLGCITVYAKPGRKKTQYDQFYYGEWVLYQTGNGNYLLNSFALEEPFHALREKIELSFLASYFAQLVLCFSRGDCGETGVLLSLLLNALHLLGQGRSPLLIKGAFEIKTMQMMGYCPTLSACGHPAGHFCLEDGSVLCGACAAKRKTLPVDATTLAALAHVLNQPPAKAFSFRIPEEAQRTFSALCEAYTLYHLEYRPSALELWKAVRDT